MAERTERHFPKVLELQTLLQDSFNFETQLLELGNSTKPQHQLSTEISSFVQKFDDFEGRNLMIVYYSGHGDWSETHGLELKA